MAPNDPTIEEAKAFRKRARSVNRDAWPAAGSTDTELGVLMELEVDHGKATVYAGVQA
jgi:hypothetical protein